MAQLGDKVTRNRMNRGVVIVVGVWSRTVTQSNCVSNEATLTFSTCELSDYQVCRSPETSGMYCTGTPAVSLRRLNCMET